jgi:hypothetical protein
MREDEGERWLGEVAVTRCWGGRHVGSEERRQRVGRGEAERVRRGEGEGWYIALESTV